MRLCGGAARACVAVCVLILALAIGACSRQPEQPREYGLGGAAPDTPGTSEDFAANVGDMVYFHGGSSKLTGHAKAILRQQARWLNKYPQYRVMVAGHSDEPGTREYNLTLAAKRAMAVKGYLTSNGLRGDRIQTVSYGRERPIAVCDNISCWSKNRRAQTVLAGGAIASY